MQRLKMCSFVLLALMLFALLVPAAAFAEAEEDEGETIASVVFESGVLEILDSAEGMDIDFGIQPLPAGAMVYESTSGPHTLSVSDARSTSKGWTMTVAATNFVTVDGDPTKEFEATIELKESSSVPQDYLTREESVIIASGAAATGVLTATGELVRGIYDTVWEGEDVLLNISDTDYVDVQVASYEATLTWTLTATL